VKLVVDTNTLISGSFWHGAPAQILEAAAQKKVELILTADLLAEFADVVGRPKFAHLLVREGMTARTLTQKLADEVTIVSPAALEMPAELRDPDDLAVLACAVGARPDAIVTGDADLLTLVSFQGIPIVNARAAIARLGLVDN
jgi:putative PIN family toxin of toxin-antitoxin system